MHFICIFIVCNMYIHAYTWYITNQPKHILALASCPIRFSWPTKSCSREWYPSARLCKGRWGWGQSLSSPEDGDYFHARPDAAEFAAETEEAINKFISGLECQEQSCFDRLHTWLSKLPVPVATTGSKMSHAAALEGGFLPKMDEEQQKRFTPSELLSWLYKHAVEYKYMSIS